MEHFGLATLEVGLAEVRAAPADDGRVELIARRPAEDEREVLDEATLDTTQGLAGDSWWAREKRKDDAQLTLMNARAAALIAGDRERWPLAGDQLYVDLDVSCANLPPGTRLNVGDEVLLEITAEPHRGCGKFARRFGVDALKFVNSEAGRELNVRGIYARIVTGGVVRPGDAIVKVP